MTQPAPDLPGLRFERLLGSGGYSDVYLYRQQLPNRHVAVKVLKDAGLAEAQRRQFTAEANAMAGLADHPNIVPVFSAAVSPDGRPFIMMMYYSRPNLAVRAASERLGVAEVLRIGIQIASAVETAHRAGILHRDIKPANLLISQFGTPGLADFGIAGQIAAMEDDEDTGVSVPWAAPEVLYSTAPTSVQSDVYALAATLWHLLVGRSPFEQRSGDNSAFALMRRIRDTATPSTGRLDVPDSLNRLLRQAMAKDPQARTQTAIDFARGLQAVEQELQLPRTEIVVTTGEDQGAYRPEPAAPTGARIAPPNTAPPSTGPPGPPSREQLRHDAAPPTVARPASISGQTPAPVGTPPPAYVSPVPPAPAVGAPEHGAPTTSRPAAHQPQVGAPRRHQPVRYEPRRPDPGGSVRAGSAAPESPARASRAPWVIIAAVLIAGLVVVGGFVLFSGGSDDSPGPASTVSNAPQTQDAGNLGEEIPPGTPKVTAVRAKHGAITYHWSYSAPRAGDTYIWREVGGAHPRSSTAKATSLTLSKSADGAHCLQVKVVRADGSNASASYSPKGCVQ